ncbi:phage tail sheath family protein [Cryptosporangium phraense]|uniref:Phage tail sheath family protein n=1 Tax=Cryptosporangium phraense TaxID=2593070 RepID=A0A545AQ40_9ACTN|nr:phage tail sheath subtilisin-like domain-containing protein [Cryptosporangium phraense]TQS43380.1 phage tail sheath family protein [Cryptosporangium phraense]
MPSYFSPGIYVEEVAGGARPIGAVGTSTAGFVGVAPDPEARVDEAVAIGSWTEFLRIFASIDDAPSTVLARAVFGFLDNGGSRCYVVNTGESAELAGTGNRRTGLQLLEAVDEIAIVAAPGQSDPASYEALLTHCEQLRDRVAILDPPESASDVSALTQVALIGEEEALRPRQSDYGALYFPWLQVRDPLTGEVVATPPSGHLAGIWARNDATRGVHKAPANEPVRGAIGLTQLVTRAEQDVLNPAGVNCIRAFGAEGIRVWGARTLAAEASEWRYVNVRRLFNMLEESIAEGTRWMVFEPNDSSLWRSIRRDIVAFLTRVWRDGALLGRTPAEAFFVQCDEETNPPDVRDQGQVVAVIGVAVVKPAEFVVFRLSQWAGGAATETLGS